METLRDYLSTGSLWGEIKNVEDFPFIGDSSTELDFQQKIEFGERSLFPPFSEVELPDIAIVIVKLYGDKWNSLISAEVDKYNITSDDEKIISETVDSDKVIDGENTTENKVSAYNSENLLTESGDTLNSTNTETLDSVKSRTETNKSLENVYINLNKIEKLNIINTVLNDVSKYLTLQIY